MKICPTCHRNYPDETLAFCLEDGTQLTTPRDSQATLVVSAARDTDPPATIVLPPEYFTAQNETVTQSAGQGTPRPAPAPTALPANPVVATPSYNPSYSPAQPAAKSSSTPLLIVVAVAAVLVIGVGGIAGLIIWQRSGPAANANGNSNNRNVTVNNVPAATPLPMTVPADSGAWMVGDWAGNGIEADTSTWTVELAVTGNNYSISYPSLGCTGQWELLTTSATEARFTEVIDRAEDADPDEGCASGGEVVVRRLGDSQLSVQWTYPDDDATGDTATAVLTKAEE